MTRRSPAALLLLVCSLRVAAVAGAAMPRRALEAPAAAAPLLPMVGTSGASSASGSATGSAMRTPPAVAANSSSMAAEHAAVREAIVAPPRAPEMSSGVTTWSHQWAGLRVIDSQGAGLPHLRGGLPSEQLGARAAACHCWHQDEQMQTRAERWFATLPHPPSTHTHVYSPARAPPSSSTGAQCVRERAASLL